MRSKITLPAAALCLLTMIVGMPASASAASTVPQPVPNVAALPHCADWGFHFISDLQRYYRDLKYPALRHGIQTDGHCILAKGDQNPGVFVLQDSLRRCYGRDIAVDAKYGDVTALTVAWLQQQLGITPDGIYGPVTGLKMRWFVDATDVPDYCTTMQAFLS
jgi:hypothetical protein